MNEKVIVELINNIFDLKSKFEVERYNIYKVRHRFKYLDIPGWYILENYKDVRVSFDNELMIKKRKFHLPFLLSRKKIKQQIMIGGL